MDPSVLRHRYLDSSSGREVGSISASVFVSDTGEPKGRWTPTPVYQATETVETLQDSQTYTRHEGFIESKPGQYFGIVLQWRSRGGALTKTWKLDDELILYYYIDGRPLPCMRYTILCPGGKNPLPLSGLWPDNDFRYPFKWSSRPGPSRNSLQPSDDIYTSTDADSPVPPPLKDVQDFSSLRITVHLRSREHESPEPNGDGDDSDQQHESPLPKNVHNQQGNHVDPTKVQHADLTECVRLDAPLQVTQTTLEDVFSGREDPASSLPFLEFRMYYKDRETLERLGICDPVDAEAPQTNGIDHPRASTSGSVPRAQSQSRSLSPPPPPPLRSTRTNVPRMNGINGTSSTVPSKRRHEDDTTDQADLPPAAESSNSRASSSSDLPPPLKQHSSSTAKARIPDGDDDDDDEDMGRGGNIGTPQQQQEPELSPATSVEATGQVESSKPHSSVSPDGRGPAGYAEESYSPENDLPDMQIDDVPDLPPAAQPDHSSAPEEERSVSPVIKEADSSQIIDKPADRQTVQDPSPLAVEKARTTPVELDVPKQENVSPQFPMPSLLQRTGLKLDSPMPSPSGSSIFPSSQQSSAGRPSLAGREDAAFAFLSEEGLDIAEPENVAALLAAGFRTKAKFLAQLPILAPSQREKILSKLEDAMEPMDYGLLYTYLSKHCGFS